MFDVLKQEFQARRFLRSPSISHSQGMWFPRIHGEGHQTFYADVAMGHNLWLRFGVTEHPFATYVDVHQGYFGF